MPGSGELTTNQANNRLQTLTRYNGNQKSYTYDANGNMRVAGDNTIRWSSFNQPLEITNSKTNTTATFLYDANQQRVQQYTGTDGKSELTTYVSKAYEVSHNDLGTERITQRKHYIYAGDRVVAIHVRTAKGNGDATPDELRYLHADALGNVDTITNSRGKVIQRMSYEPFGERSITRNLASDPDAAAWTERGFTGHEHLDGLGLIHMGARLYDPAIGRFLSPDTYIQAPAAAFIGTLAKTGSFRAALISGFWAGVGAAVAGFVGHGGAFGYEFSQTLSPFGDYAWLAHGISQGVLTQLRGGQFKSGFVGAIISSAAGAMMGRMGGTGPAAIAASTVTAAVFGGLAAEATGGSFADGALVAAMVHLFNHEAGYKHSHQKPNVKPGAYPIKSVSGSGAIGEGISVAGEGGVVFLFDDDNRRVLQYVYKGGGIGAGYGFCVSDELYGAAYVEDASSLEGWALSVEGDLVRGGGITGTLQFPLKWDFWNGTNASIGPGVGQSIGISGLITHAEFFQTYNYNDNPYSISDPWGYIGI